MVIGAIALHFGRKRILVKRFLHRRAACSPRRFRVLVARNKRRHSPQAFPGCLNPSLHCVFRHFYLD
jgi:hypothetical protein